MPSESDPKKRKDIVVMWQSAADPSLLDSGLEAFGLRAKRDRNKPDCRVLDLRQFVDMEAAIAAYRSQRLPTLVVVSDMHEEAAALSWMEIGDDVCTADAIDSQAGYRLARLFWNNARLPNPRIDNLTGLSNRYEFTRVLDIIVDHARPDSPVSVIFADIDNFKRLNDCHGHAAGDYVLREVAAIFRRGARGTEIVARCGGEEFAIATRTDLHQATSLAEYLREQTAENDFSFDGSSLTVTVSFGVATATGDCTLDELFRRADASLYSAKAGGRNRVVSADEFAREASESGDEFEIRDFENRVRVLTERLTQILTSRSRTMASRIKREAERDGLTGHFVRRYFDTRLVREMENARRHVRKLSLIFLDVDHFRSVNRTYGFPTGDRALRYVAEILRNAIRTVDWVARYGGEEFCVVMPDSSLEHAVRVAERIRAKLTEDTIVSYDGRQLSLTASLGVAELGKSDQSPEDFVQRASDKTREAKRSGRNAVRS